MCFLSLRERHVSSQFDDFSQLIHPFFTNVHRLIASRSLCSLCALILPRQTPFHFHYWEVEVAGERRWFVSNWERDGERRWFVLRILRGDTNEVCSTEVTETSDTH